MRPLVDWSLRERSGIRGVLTDIDDTLTTRGQLTPDVLKALARLRQANIRLIAVTGRPTYWALPLLRLCGFDAVIAKTVQARSGLINSGDSEAASTRMRRPGRRIVTRWMPSP